MAMFEQLNILKERIKDEIMLNQNLLKLVYYTDYKPLECEEIDIPTKLVNDYIYFSPIAYDQTVQENKVLLVLAMRQSPTYKFHDFVDADFYIRIIMHNSLNDIEIDHKNWSRALAICEELNKSFLKSRGNWLGECDFKLFEEITTTQDTYGVLLKYSVTNFKA